MKSIFKSFLAVAAMASVITISSCTKTCDPGYEGNDCKTEMRTKFLGIYGAADSPGGLVYNATIGAGTGISDVTIGSTFSDDYFVNSVKATVDGTTITIARQEPDNDDYFVEGTGTINGKVISWNYKLIDATAVPEISISYTGTWTKP